MRVNIRYMRKVVDGGGGGGEGRGGGTRGNLAQTDAHKQRQEDKNKPHTHTNIQHKDWRLLSCVALLEDDLCKEALLD